MIKMLRVFFYLIYEPLAWSYDWVSWLVSLGRWKSWVLSVLPYLPGPRVLELGHGPGHLLRALARLNIRAVGLDRSWQMSLLACYRGRRLSFDSVYVNGYAQYLPFKSASFHQVVATFPSEYLWQPQTLGEVRRVLTPEGQLIALPIAWITGSGPLDALLRLVFRLTGQAPDPANPAVLNTLMEALRAAGFRVQAQYKDFKSSRVLILQANLARQSE